MISVVAIEAVMKPAPHRASAMMLRCCSQESNRRHPASAGVKTVIASTVERLGTVHRNRFEIARAVDVK
jgi:hypothetical protein